MHDDDDYYYHYTLCVHCRPLNQDLGLKAAFVGVASTAAATALLTQLKQPFHLCLEISYSTLFFLMKAKVVEH